MKGQVNGLVSSREGPTCFHDRDLRHDRIKQGYFRPILEIQENGMKKENPSELFLMLF